MRLVATTRVLDEADIIEAFVRHTSHYVSHHIFIDNGSRDGTVAILEKLRVEGFNLVVYQNLSVSFNEVPFNTRMYKEAVELHGADWVLCLDADEFIDDSGLAGGLLETLDRLGHDDPTLLCLRVPLLEYRQSPRDDMDDIVVPTRQKHHFPQFDVDKVFLSKRLLGPDLEVSGGNHFASVDGKQVASRCEPGLRLAHFAVRSPYQLAAKWIKGWAKVLAAGPAVVAAGASDHYRNPFRVLADTPSLLMRDPAFLDLEAHLPLTEDPALYRGGPLRYTSPTDEPVRALQMVVGYIERLADQHGRLVETIPEAKRLVEEWDAIMPVVVGDDKRPAAPVVHEEQPVIRERSWKQAIGRLTAMRYARRP